MPLPENADPYATWWTIYCKEHFLHGVMCMKKRNVESNPTEYKPSQIADEHKITGLVRTGNLSLLDHLFSGSERPSKRQKTHDEPKPDGKSAPVKPPVTESSSSKSKDKNSEWDPMEVENQKH